jgi:hypothetical protein
MRTTDVPTITIPLREMPHNHLLLQPLQLHLVASMLNLHHSLHYNRKQMAYKLRARLPSLLDLLMLLHLLQSHQKQVRINPSSPCLCFP